MNAYLRGTDVLGEAPRESEHLPKWEWESAALIITVLASLATLTEFIIRRTKRS